MFTEEPLYFACDDQQLFGELYRPQASPRSAIVFCNPFFEERKAAQGVMVDAARALASAGHAVLRFDYRGCGDSSGCFHEANFQRWRNDLAAARTLLRTKCEAPLQGVLALRFGATLALPPAAAQPPPDFSVLWAPLIDGQAYLADLFRRKLVKEMMTFGKSRKSRDDLFQALADGHSVDLDSYELTASLYRDMISFTLPEPPRATAQHLLCITIGASSNLDAGLSAYARAAADCGQTVSIESTRARPFWDLIGLTQAPELIARTVAWIDALPPHPSRADNATRNRSAGGELTT